MKTMITHILALAVLAVTYGAFWHNQPARPQNKRRGDYESQLGRLVTRALEWLLLIPHVANPLTKTAHVVPAEKDVITPRESELFRPALGTLRRLNPWRRLLLDRTAATALSKPVDSFEKANLHALAAGKTT